jgi:hypothetical protein
MTECGHDEMVLSVAERGACCHHERKDCHEAPAVPSGDEHECSCLCCNGGILRPDGDASTLPDMMAFSDQASASLQDLLGIGRSERAPGEVPLGPIESGRLLRARIMSLTI